MPSFRRVDAPTLPPPRFYIKGSYVLDVIFGRSKAQDVDVFYDKSCQRPTASAARNWLQENGFPQHANIDGPIPVDNIDDCSGGGFPEFNIDRWHIRNDGTLYTLEDTDERAEHGGLFGRSPYKTRVVPLDLELARRTPLTVLFPPYRVYGEDGIKRIEKAIRKMSEHPELVNDALRLELEATLNALNKGEEPEVSNDAEADDDFEVEL